MIRKTFAVLLLLAVFMPLNAQELDSCFGLSAEDCAVIGSASENTLTTLTSFTHTFSLDFSLSGLEALDLGEDVSLDITGTGTFTQADSELVPNALSLTMEGTVDGSETGVINLRLVDDVLYLQTGEAGWQSIAFEEVLRSPALASANLAQLPFASLNTEGQTDLATSLQSIASLLNTPNFITYQRLEAVEGRTPFSFSLDFVPLFASDEFRQLLDQALNLASSLDASLESTAMIAPFILDESDLKMNLTQYVNTETNMVDELTLTIDGAVDLNTLLGTTAENQIDPITLRLDFLVEIANINQPVTVEAPSNATPVSLSELGLE